MQSCELCKIAKDTGKSIITKKRTAADVCHFKMSCENNYDRCVKNNLYGKRVVGLLDCDFCPLSHGTNPVTVMCCFDIDADIKNFLKYRQEIGIPPEVIMKSSSEVNATSFGKFTDCFPSPCHQSNANNLNDSLNNSSSSSTVKKSKPEACLPENRLERNERKVENDYFIIDGDCDIVEVMKSAVAAAEQTKNEFDYINHPLLMMLNATPGMYSSSNADIYEFIRNDKRFNLIHNLSDRGGDIAAFGNLYCTIITAKRPVSSLIFGSSITLKSTGSQYKLGKNFRKKLRKEFMLKQGGLTKNSSTQWIGAIKQILSKNLIQKYDKHEKVWKVVNIKDEPEIEELFQKIESILSILLTPNLVDVNFLDLLVQMYAVLKKFHGDSYDVFVETVNNIKENMKAKKVDCFLTGHITVVLAENWIEKYHNANFFEMVENVKKIHPDCSTASPTKLSINKLLQCPYCQEYFGKEITKIQHMNNCSLIMVSYKKFKLIILNLLLSNLIFKINFLG